MRWYRSGSNPGVPTSNGGWQPRKLIGNLAARYGANRAMRLAIAARFQAEVKMATATIHTVYCVLASTDTDAGVLQAAAGLADTVLPSEVGGALLQGIQSLPSVISAIDFARNDPGDLYITLATSAGKRTRSGRRRAIMVRSIPASRSISSPVSTSASRRICHSGIGIISAMTSSARSPCSPARRAPARWQKSPARRSRALPITSSMR